MEPHVFLPYPKGHAFTKTCLKCGRVRDHPSHIEPVREPGETTYPPVSAVRRGGRF